MLEWGILICLFNATIEQQSMLIGLTKHQAKVIFKRWQAEGDKLMKIIENTSDMDKIYAVSDLIHNTINEIRKINEKEGRETADANQ